MLNNNNKFKKFGQILNILIKMFNKENIPPEGRKKDNVYRKKLSVFEVKKIEENKKDIEGLVFSICITGDERIAVCSEDRDIQILNKKSLGLELSLKGHNKAVNHISLLENGYLVSSSEDLTIKIWELKDKLYKCLKTLIGHKNEVRKTIQITHNRLVSCSDDGTLKVWNSMPPYECFQTLTNHSFYVRAVIELKNKKFFVSGGTDGTVRFWNSSNYHCEHTVQKASCSFTNGLIEGKNKLYLGTVYGKIKVISTLTYQIETVFVNNISKHQIFCCLYLNDESLIYGDSFGNLIQITVDQWKEYQVKERGHFSPICDIKLLSDNQILVGTRNNVHIWKL